MVKPLAAVVAIDENSWQLKVQIVFAGILLAEYEGVMEMVGKEDFF
jgi:hypothetical protein